MRSGDDRKRRLAYLTGLDGERLALLWLRLKGYRPLARRFRAPGGEIDLIVKRGRTIVAVEVKARDTLDLAAASITPRQIARIGVAMRHFRSERRIGDSYIVRLDAVLIAPGRWPRHVTAIGDLG